MNLSSYEARLCAWAMPFTAVLVMLPAALAAGCAPQEEQGGTLDNGNFNYACVSTDDPECPDDVSDTPTAFPTIALGGTFSLTYTSTNSSYDEVTVLAVSPDFFLSQGQNFTAIRTGGPGFFAETPQGTIIDYTQVDVEPISSIQIADTTQSFSSSDVHTYTATAEGSIDEPLGGLVKYEWASSDPSVLAIQGGQMYPSPTVNAVFLKNGHATLTAKSADTTGSLNVDVSGGE
jgi:hypothetical protein